MAGVATMDYKDRRVLPARVRVIHWLIVLLSGLAAVTIALPSVLSQRIWYQSTATVRFDPTILPPLIADGRPTEALKAQQDNLGEVLLQRKYPTLRQRGLGYQYSSAQEIVITTQALAPDQAMLIARDAADGLARRMYAVSGLPLLRTVLGHAQQASYEGHPKQSREDDLLRYMLLAQGIDGVVPQQGERPIESLSQVERIALTRALEVQYELSELDRFRAEQQLRTLDQRSAEERQQPTLIEQRRVAVEQQRGATNAITANRLLTDYMYKTYRTNADTTNGVTVTQAATPATAIPTYSALKLAIAGAVGLTGGLLAVLIDRQVGILTKLQELWSYRALVRNMIARDLKARYKNSLLGYLWSLLNPLLMMLIFWVVFSLLLQNGIPMFPVFLIVALLPWNYAVTSVSSGMRAILDNSNLVKKVYFPREILPITVVLSNLVNYLLALPIMFLVMGGVQWATLGHLNFSWYFAFLPVIVVIQTIFLLGMTLLLSTMAVFFRDTTHIIDIFIQMWIFLTPVFFALEQIATPNFAKLVRWLNPMASLIDFYRDILYGQVTNPVPGLPALDGVFRTLLTALVVLAFGAYIFHRHSGRFGEEI